MRKKNNIVLLVALVLLSSMFLGCGGKARMKLTDDGYAFSTKNIFGKPIMAMTGTSQYITPKGNIKTFAWLFNFVGSFHSSPPLDTDKEYTFSKIRDRNNRGSYITQMNPKCTAILFSDGTTWGTSGVELKEKVIAKLEKAHGYLIAIKDRFQEMTPVEVLLALNANKSFVDGYPRYGLAFQYSLKAHLLGKQELLPDNYMEKVDQLIANIESSPLLN